MDQTAKFQKSLEALGLEGVTGLKNLPSQELEQKLTKALGKSHTRPQVLQLHIVWLYQQLLDLDLSDDYAVASGITTWCNSLQVLGYVKDEVTDAFGYWQTKQAEVDPSSARRFQLARHEIEGRYPSPPGNSTSNVISAELSKHDVNNPINIDSPFSSASSSSSSSSDVSVIFLDDEMANKYFARPVGSYVCDRCGERGHYLQHCPTNMDPAFDRKPDNTYVCDICKKRGDHIKSLCPHNPHPYSLTQKRKRAAESQRAFTSHYDGNLGYGSATHHQGTAVTNHHSGHHAAGSTTAHPRQEIRPGNRNKILPFRNNRVVSPEPESDYMAGYIHKSRRGQLRNPGSIEDQVSHSQGSLDVRVTKRHKSDNWQTHACQLSQDEANTFKDIFLGASTSEGTSSEGRLSYYDVTENDETMVKMPSRHYCKPGKIGDHTLSKTMAEPKEDEPPCGWEYAEMLGYSKDWARDRDNFLDSVFLDIEKIASAKNVANGTDAKAKDGEKDGVESNEDTAVPNSMVVCHDPKPQENRIHVTKKRGRDFEASVKSPIRTEVEPPREVIAIPSIAGVQLDASDMDRVNTVKRHEVVKLFRDSDNRLSPRRARKRATAMEFWTSQTERAREAAVEKLESIDLATTGEVETTDAAGVQANGDGETEVGNHDQNGTGKMSDREVRL